MATDSVVDYSFSRPGAQAIKDGGFIGAVRYLAPLPNSKVITASERDELLGAGLAIGLVWESVNQRAANSGYNGGISDAQYAVRLAQNLGATSGMAIYFVLEDPNKLPQSAWPSILAYAHGVKDILSGTPFVPGGYGSQDLIETAVDQGLIQYGWQVGGWSHGISSKCHLYQRVGYVLNNTSDSNGVLQTDWGQWPRPSSAPPIKKEDKMLFVVKGDKTSEWWLTDWISKRYIASVDEFNVIVYVTAANGGKVAYQADGPLVIPQAVVDRVPRNDVPGTSGGSAPASGTVGLTDAAVAAVAAASAAETGRRLVKP